MDAVAPRGDDPLEASIRQAQAALANAIAKAHLSGDPMGVALEAMSATLGSQLALHQASTRHLRDVGERLDRQVAESLTRVESEIAINEARVVADLAPRLAAGVNRSLAAGVRMAQIRLIAARVAGGVALAVAGITAGYWMGKTAGEAEMASVRSAIDLALTRDGPAGADIWRRLIAYNDPVAAIAKCRQAMATQDGRGACLMPVWTDPPAPPRHP